MDPNSDGIILEALNELSSAGIVLGEPKDETLSVVVPSDELPLPASQRVPPEILTLIVDRVGRLGPHWIPDTRTLYAFIRVSRTWMSAGLPALYLKPEYFRISRKMKLLLPEDGKSSNLTLLKEVNTMGFIDPLHLECFTNLRVLKFAATSSGVFEPLLKALSSLKSLDDLDILFSSETARILGSVPPLSDSGQRSIVRGR